jgi:hypothetical protein
MKYFFSLAIFFTLFVLLTACGQSATATTLPIPSPSMTQTPTIVPTSSPTVTATIEPTPRPTYVWPTLIPTIEPTLLPELLQNTFSIETIDLSGYNTRLITGWEHGFGADIWYANCPSYVWLDTNHLLLYPGAGQERPPEGMGILGINVVPQPVVMNLETGSVWLPPVDLSSGRTCNRVFWSHDLGVLINSGIYKETPAVFTHTFDGKKLANYRGQFSQVSPSNEKVLIDNNILIDLRTNSRTTLAWSLEDYEEQMLSEVFWTSDETRLYRCCYFYADLTNGTSYRYTESDFLDRQGNPLNYEGLWMYRGEWVQDDKYFLVWWSYLDDGDIRYLPMFDPAEKLLYDVREMAGISPDLTCPETDVSPDGQYLWIMCYDVNYLVDLSSFETTIYPGYTQVDIYWSNDSQFAWLANYNMSENNIEIFSVANKELTPLPITPLPQSDILWNPNSKILVYPVKDKNALVFLDVSMMIYRELPFEVQDSQSKISNLAWNPNGDKLIFITEHHILWQVDYPTLENLEQIIASTNTIGGAQWSPDGKSISFLNGTDIYIVDTNK